MSRVICPNCGRAYQMHAAGAECPRCHYRAGASGYTPAPTSETSPRPPLAGSTFTLAPPDPAPMGMLPPQPSFRSQGTNGMAVASLVLGIIGLILWPLAFIALTLGIVGKVQTNRTRQPGGGLAIAGIVLGTFVIAIGILILVMLYIAFGQQ